MKSISIIGSKKDVGKNTLAANIACELSKKNLRVVLGNSLGEHKNNYLIGESFWNQKENIAYYSTKIKNLEFLNFSKEFAHLSPGKLEELLNHLPEDLNQRADYFIFSASSPLDFPDRYMLLNADMTILVGKIDSTLLSDIFQQLEKISFLPKKPEKLYLVLNSCRNQEKAVDTYHKILDNLNELNIELPIHFLGMVPEDEERMEYAKKMQKPMIEAFPNIPFHGSIAAITAKIFEIDH